MDLIVGTGLAAVRAVEALREAGSSEPIIMVGSERVLPYDRPPLSKAFLRGETTLAETLIHEADFYAAQRVELDLGVAARALRVSTRTVELEDGRELRFDKLLIATGAEPRTLSVPGAHLDGVATLRTGADALRLKTELARAERLVVVGGGLIGLEVAAVARTAGKSVTVIEAARQPMARLLDVEQVASAVADLHREHGAVVRTQTTVTELRGAGRVEEVILSTGERTPADLVLVAIGVKPALGWLEGSGLHLDDGVLTDDHLQTNVPGIFAAGDVARAFNPLLGREVRFESYGSAQEQGAVAGRAMAGRLAVANILPSAGSEQYGARLQILGTVGGAGRVLVRGSFAQRSFVAFFLVDGAVRGAFLMNRARDLPAVRRLVAQRVPIDERRIADEAEPIAAAIP